MMPRKMPAMISSKSRSFNLPCHEEETLAWLTPDLVGGCSRQSYFLRHSLHAPICLPLLLKWQWCEILKESKMSSSEKIQLLLKPKKLEESLLSLMKLPMPMEQELGGLRNYGKGAHDLILIIIVGGVLRSSVPWLGRWCSRSDRKGPDRGSQELLFGDGLLLMTVLEGQPPPDGFTKLVN